MERSYAEFNKVSDMLKVLAHPVRLCIVQGLIESGEANVSNMQACLDTPQSTTSQHLQKLKAMGIVESRREGLEVYYRISSPLTSDLMKVLFTDAEN